MERICCEVCLSALSEEEERAFLAAYNATPESELWLLSATCAGCRERDRAVQQRMDRVLRDHFAETGRTEANLGGVVPRAAKGAGGP